MIEENKVADNLFLAERATRLQDAEQARLELRHWLCAKLDDDQVSGSLSEILNRVSERGLKNKTIPPVLLRFLAEDEVIPTDGWKNDVQRAIVAICETATPELCSFLKIPSKAQTFEKFSHLEGAHLHICSLLEVVKAKHSDIDSLLAAHKSVISPLIHGQIRLYGAPFGIEELRVSVDAVFTRLRAISNPGATFVEDFTECRRALSQCKSIAIEIGSFIALDYILPLTEMVDGLLEAYVDKTRARFLSDLNADWMSSTLPKKYPLHEVERVFDITLPFRNDGAGMAVDVRIATVLDSDAIFLETSQLSMGNVMPGEFSVVIRVMILSPCASFSGAVELDWAEVGSNVRKKRVFDFGISAQAHGIDWVGLTYWNPYSTEVAKGSEFIGRVEQVQHLASKILRTPMEPFYITGQKRVGKTSLVKAATSFAEEHTEPGKMINHFILWGDVAHVDPATALRQIGESIEDFVAEHLPAGVGVPKQDYSGSLSALLKVFDTALKFLPDVKIVITIDEFDEIPQDLYLHGNLAETFFANLRSISRRDNVCLILVGGENMPYVMSRQGQKLNTFTEISLNYFSRESEWADFQEMIRKPTEGKLSWHDDAISEVFNISNGNPYYAKLVCAGVARRAVSTRDADITRHEVKSAADEQISSLGSNSFAHLWQDGIPKAPEDREPDVLRRSRVLVAAARCMRNRTPLSISNLADKKISLALNSAEIQSVLNDFQMRLIVEETSSGYLFTLPIFQWWLADVGASKLVADTLSEELAQSTLAEENAAMVRSDEVVALSRSWPTYRGKTITTDEIRAWYQQVPEFKHQRILFEVLKKVKFFSEAHIRERLRTAHTFVRNSIPPEIQTNRNQRRNDILVVYVDGEGKSGSAYAAMYAEENRISAKAICSLSSFDEKIDDHARTHGRPAAIVVIDDIAASGNSLEGNLRSFVSTHSAAIGDAKLRAISIVSTQAAYDRLVNALGSFEVDSDFRACEVVGDEHQAFPSDKTGWQSEEMWERAKALCNQIGASIYHRNPLGYGDMGLLIVFPTTVPNNSLPILHSHSKAGSKLVWAPLFHRITH